ncbi:MAG: winged helix-turn-helix domain-containing protein [Tildeniella nuda ZEHNDER 1965/U140]|jgi:biotin operon repressor|nr:winged helix-turn-helix domain-containing protein [Tildeniella nuda ZEHNDER 1965/U140]
MHRFDSRRELTPATKQMIQKSTMEFNRRKILNLISSSIQGDNRISDQQISEQLKMSLDEVSFHLDELERGGFVKLIRNHTFNTNGEALEPIAVTPRGRMLLEGKISFENALNSSPNSQVFKVTNHAPVAAQQYGNKNTANVTQNIGLDTAEILQMLHALRQEVSSLPSENQTTAIEALDDIEEEVKTPTRTSRIRGGLLSLWSVVKDIASFANAVTALAQRFGMDHLLS